MVPISTSINLGLIQIEANLPELGQKLAEVIEKAKGPRVELSVLLYLRVAQAAIRALGKERQAIISAASECDLQDRVKVEDLSKRMHVYLREDNVRDKLERAIEGLRGCREDIESKAEGLIKWRSRNKQEAVKAFLTTLDDLNGQAQNLVHTFFPGYSGRGLPTLRPISELIDRVGSDLRRGRASDVEADEEELAKLVRDALRDPAQDSWIKKEAIIEGLIVKLRSAFSVKGGSITEKGQ